MSLANLNKLTARQFTAIKLLLKGGATQSEAATYMQVSANTVFWISKAETFEEYQTIKAEKELKKKQAVAAKKQAEEKAKTAQAAQVAQVAPTPAEEPKPQTQEVVKEIRQTVTVQATHYMMQELQKTNELLKSISMKLGYIVEDLYGKKEG